MIRLSTNSSLLAVKFLGVNSYTWIFYHTQDVGAPNPQVVQSQQQ